MDNIGAESLETVDRLAMTCHNLSALLRAIPPKRPATTTYEKLVQCLIQLTAGITSTIVQVVESIGPEDVTNHLLPRNFSANPYLQVSERVLEVANHGSSSVHWGNPKRAFPWCLPILDTPSLLLTFVETIRYGSTRMHARSSISTKYNLQTASGCTHPSVS